jgi:hypothetical protein
MSKTRSAGVRALRFGPGMQRTDAATDPPRRTEREHTPAPPDTSPNPDPATAPPGDMPPAPDPTPDAESARHRQVPGALKAIAFHAGVIVLFTIPAIILWWHVWTTHPSTTMTCPCGDPAQQVWFTAWPAYALAHGHNLVFSQWVNVPHGANLLSNTSGTLVSVVLAPITWAWGPIAATNVALTLAPALSAWGCFVALRPLVKWKAGAFPAALVYGYSAAIVTSLVFGHVSVTMLVIPPILFTLLHEIFVRQEHAAFRDGICLAALLVVQFFISPEVLVICALLGVVGLVPVLVVGWRQLRVRAWHALPALTLGLVVAGVVLAYPVWFGLAGPQAVTGVLFGIAPLSGVALAGVLSPGNYGSPADAYVRFGGYLGRAGPQPDFIGAGAAAAAVASFILAWRRLLTWLVVLLAVVALWFSLGAYQFGVTPWLTHLWLPWRELGKLALLKEILPGQIVPFISLFVAFLLAFGLDALFTLPTLPADPADPADPAVPAASPGDQRSWFDRHRTAVTLAATAAVGVAALLPVFLTFDMPFKVTTVRLPQYFTKATPALPPSTVLLTIPFAVSGTAQPMLWQAVDGFDFRLAGAALKTPNATGGPVQQGAPGSARKILTTLSVGGATQPTGAAAELLTVRRALVQWHVQRVVIAGNSLDPIYASGFFTEALGVGPVFEDNAWVWTLKPGWTSVKPAFGAELESCRAAADAPAVKGMPLFMSSCVLFDPGRALEPTTHST